MKLPFSRPSALLRTIIPWMVALLLLGYLFKKYPLARLIQASHYLNVFPFLCYSSVYFSFILLLDCICFSRAFAHFGYPLRLSGVLTARLASHIPMLMNYGVGQGALAYLFNRKHGIPFLKASSLIFFVTLADLYITVTLAFAGSFFFHATVEGFSLVYPTRILWIGFTCALASFFFIRKLRMPGMISRWPKLGEIFYIVQGGRMFDFAKLMLMRLPMHLALNTSLYFTALTFQVHIPFLQCLAYSPFVVLTGIFPITPGGLGTVQAATAEIFKDIIHIPFFGYGAVSASELLFFMSLVLVLANYAFKALTGIIFFKDLLITSPYYSEEYPA